MLVVQLGACLIGIAVLTFSRWPEGTPVKLRAWLVFMFGCSMLVISGMAAMSGGGK